MSNLQHSQTSVPLADLSASDRKETRRRIVDLAWPAFTEMVLLNLIGMLNMIMVSRVGPNAVAAVALTNQPVAFALALFVTLNVGATVIVSRAIGGGNAEEANRAAQVAFNVNLLIMFPLTILFTVFSGTVLRWMGASPEVIQEGIDYTRLMFISLGFMIMSSGVSAVLRGAGDTKTSAKVNVSADIVTVALGVPLIYGWFGLPELGVTGAGVSTLVARFIAAIWLLRGAFSGRKMIILSWSKIWQYDSSLLRRIVKIGLPAAGETLIIRLSMIFLNVLLAYLGTEVLAANQIAFNILGLTWLPAIAFATAAATLVGQSLGASNPALAERFGWQTNNIAMLLSAIVGIGFIIFPEWIFLIYTNDSEVIHYGSVALQVIGFTQVFQAAQYVLAGALRGAGDTKYNMKVAFWGVILFRVLLTSLFIFVFDWGLFGAWLALAIDQVFRSSLFAIRFRKGKWKTIRV